MIYFTNRNPQWQNQNSYIKEVTLIDCSHDKMSIRGREKQKVSTAKTSFPFSFVFFSSCGNKQQSRQDILRLRHHEKSVITLNFSCENICFFFFFNNSLSLWMKAHAEEKTGEIHRQIHKHIKICHMIYTNNWGPWVHYLQKLSSIYQYLHH